MLLLLTAFFCAVLPEIVVASRCANTPWIGRSLEIIATNFDDVTCGETPNSYDCPRYIEAKSNSANGCSQVRLAGRYSLLGSLSCNPSTGNNNCSLITTGDIIVGCCGSYTAYETFIGGDGSTLTIGANSHVSLAKLQLEESTSLTVGDDTTISDLSQTNFAVQGNSHITFTSGVIPSAFVFENTTIETTDFCTFTFYSKGRVTIQDSTWIVQSGTVDIKLLSTNNVFIQVAITAFRSSAIIHNLSPFEWFNTTLNLVDYSSIHWDNRTSVTFTSTNVTMLDGSGWTAFGSEILLNGVTIYFGSDSFFFLNRVDFTATGVIPHTISIGNRSTLYIRSPTAIKRNCNLIADLIIPPDVHYTYVNVSNVLICRTSAKSVVDTNMLSDRFEADEMREREKEAVYERIERNTIHYNSCSIAAATTTDRTKLTTATTTDKNPIITSMDATTITDASTTSINSPKLPDTTETTSSGITPSGIRAFKCLLLFPLIPFLVGLL